MHAMCSNIWDVQLDALDTLADHAPLRKLGFWHVHMSHVNVKAAILRLLALAKQGSRLTIEVPEELFSQQQADEAVQEAARARLSAGVPGGVPALTVRVNSG
jgi:hypothetical protein